jgi:hypothetical protein
MEARFRREGAAGQAHPRLAPDRRRHPDEGLADDFDLLELSRAEGFEMGIRMATSRNAFRKARCARGGPTLNAGWAAWEHQGHR